MKSQYQTRGQILLTYVKLRRNGTSRAEAIEKVRPDAFHLSPEERQLLGKDMSQWEEEQQKQAAPTPSAAPSPGATTPLTDNMLFGIQNPDQNKLSPALNQSELPQLCPKCKKKNKFKAERCAFCGAVLKSRDTPTFKFPTPDRDHKAKPNEPGHMYLIVKSHKQPLEVFVRNEMVVGRSSVGSSLKPDIDLAPYDAEKQGVSRSHASLKMEGETIVITDLESSNLTHINGERLYPHETRVLRHGDEIQLGKLTVKVMFKL